MQIKTLRVDRGMAGKRLDRFLCAMLPQMSRSYLQKLVEGGKVARGGTSLLKPSMKVAYDDVVEVILPLPEKAEMEPEDIPLHFLHEDDDVAIVEKPAGMVVHPAAGHARGTFVNALLHHLKGRLSGVGGVERPGLVHRLDKGVSGLLVVAKNDLAHRALQEMFKARRVEKIYLALVRGCVWAENGRIEEPIGRHPRFRKKMAVVPDGRSALTLYRVLRRFGTEATLLEVNLKTGRSHQIRVHLSHVGHPIVGDALYGGGSVRSLDGGTEGFRRIALHAHRLSFAHPRTGIPLSFESPLPEAMKTLMESFSRAGEEMTAK